MAKIHDLFIVELAEVIKGYGNNPDYKDPFRLSEFYRFYELPNIAVSRENFEKMRPIEPERKKGEWIPEFDGKFIGGAYWFSCSKCKRIVPEVRNGGWNFCPNCGRYNGGNANGDE